LILTLSILLVWTVVFTWTWKLEVVSFEPLETYRECVNDHFWDYFGPLMALTVFTEPMSVFFVLMPHPTPKGMGAEPRYFWRLGVTFKLGV
jgi:hypothetical protein